MISTFDISPSPTSTGDRRVLFQCWSWAHKFAVSWNRISIVTGYRFGIRGPSPLPSTYPVMPALEVSGGWGGVGRGDTREKLAGKAASE